jgi:hypothetical protein|tara:strand:+ start:243 stop:575 length:333 start_codon:yes stop_codon:yes gene_type:complete
MALVHNDKRSGGRPENQNEISILPPPPSSEVLPGGRPELGENFMDANMNNFASLTDPSSVDQSGRTISRLEGGENDKLNQLGIETAMNPPFSVPNQKGIDDTGVNSIYNT